MDSSMIAELEEIGRAHATRRQAIVDFIARYDLDLLKRTFGASLDEFKTSHPVPRAVETFLRGCLEAGNLPEPSELYGTGRTIREIKDTLAYLERDRDPEELAEPSLGQRVMEFLEVFHRKVVSNVIANALSLLDDGEAPNRDVYERAYCRTIEQIGGIAALERLYLRARSFTREIQRLLEQDRGGETAPDGIELARVLVQVERLRAWKEFEHYKALYDGRRKGQTELDR